MELLLGGRVILEVVRLDVICDSLYDALITGISRGAQFGDTCGCGIVKGRRGIVIGGGSEE